MLVLLTLVAASFFFALAESALFSLGSWRARRLLESGRRGSERVGNRVVRKRLTKRLELVRFHL